MHWVRRSLMSTCSPIVFTCRCKEILNLYIYFFLDSDDEEETYCLRRPIGTENTNPVSPSCDNNNIIIDIEMDSDNDSDDCEQVSRRRGSKRTSDSNSMIPFQSVFDTHCHLEFIRRRNKNVRNLSDCMKMDGENLGDKFRGCIVNYCQPSEWSRGPNHDQVSQLLLESSEDNRIGITIGCHPHFADQMTEDRWRQLSRLVSCPSPPQLPWLRLVAVGECGLDYSRKNTVPKEIQKKVFTRQLQLAIEHNLPIVLHIRDAEEDGLDVLDQAGVPPNYPIHRHCFGGDLEAAVHWILKFPGSKIGVTGLITYPHAVDAVKVVQQVSMEKLLLETDAPYFVPRAVKLRHNCSFPGHVIHVAREVAKIKKITLNVVLNQNLINAREIYKLFFSHKDHFRIRSYQDDEKESSNFGNNRKKSKVEGK